MSCPLPSRALEWQKKVRRFVDDELIPWEVEAEMNEGELPGDVATRHKEREIACRLRSAHRRVSGHPVHAG